MSLKERTYSILVVSSTDSFASAFIGSLPEIRYYPVLTASSVSAAKPMLKEKSFDLFPLSRRCRKQNSGPDTDL